MIRAQKMSHLACKYFDFSLQKTGKTGLSTALTESSCEGTQQYFSFIYLRIWIQLLYSEPGEKSVVFEVSKHTI